MGEERYLFKQYLQEEKQDSKKKKESPFIPLPPLSPVTIQNTLGNREIQYLFDLKKIRAKLYMSHPADHTEMQADKIAEQIVHTGYENTGKNAVPLIKKISTGTGQDTVPQKVQSRIESLDHGGKPLDRNTKDYFLPRFGIDMDFVRIHTDSQADRLARAIQARAFVSKNHIVFAKGEYQPETTSGKKLIAHELVHVLQNNSTVIHRQQQQIDIPQIIRNAYKNYSSGLLTMPELARVLIEFAPTHTSEILSIFNSLPEHHRDNLAYAMAANSIDAKIISFTQDILDRMITELGKWTNTFKHRENWAQKDRIYNLLYPQTTQIQQEASENITLLRATFNNNITGSVGSNGTNSPLDVQLIARGLRSRGYKVPAVSLNRGICTPELISIIRSFQRGVMKMENPDGLVGHSGATIRTLFNKQNNSYSSGLHDIFGQSAGTLNRAIGQNDLETWNRTDQRNAVDNLYHYTINTRNFMNRGTYERYIRALARHQHVGVTANSNLDRALDIAARAARDETFFNALTRDVTATFRFYNERNENNMEGQQVNFVLKERIQRYHKFLSAVGLFRGDMWGSSTRSAIDAHRKCIPHVVRSRNDIRPVEHKQSIRNNLITVYNRNAVAGGRRREDGTVEDSSGYSWARPGDFILNEDGVATAMNDATWFVHISRIDPNLNWNTYRAEGYKLNDQRRFPLGLNIGPGRSNHITGDAVDINESNFVNMNDAILDLIALYFGIMRPVPREHWHFECTNVELSNTERALIQRNGRDTVLP
ncbi:MAG: DUF4157 domain-containing protein [Spirochaetales bacterium]|nr:DUF4157 domain-containing protein [Spirochaetales bacterium]